MLSKQLQIFKIGDLQLVGLVGHGDPLLSKDCKQEELVGQQIIRMVVSGSYLDRKDQIRKCGTFAN